RVSARQRFRCGRCGTVQRPADPGGAVRLGAVRYVIYAAASGMGSAAIALAMAELGDHPLGGPGVVLSAWALAALGAGCPARPALVGMRASDVERLVAWERGDLQRTLCPGMIRSDVVDALARRGWTIGKIRAVLGAFKPA